MRSIQKILVPFDGSEQSNEAIAYAADIARRYEASIMIMYVDHPLTYALPPGYDLPSRELLERIQASIEREVARHLDVTARALRVQTLVQRGDPVTEILRCATNDGYQLIVMGTHRRTALARAVLGSVTETIVRHAPCPVLAVRSEEA